MSFCTQQILELAGSIYTGIGAPTAQSVGYVSGWLTSSGTLGALNLRLSTCYYLSGSAPCIAGGFGDQEGEILKLIYEKEYYFGQSRAVLAAGGLMWVNLSEGDSRVSRASPVDMSKAFLALHEKAEEELFVAVHAWKTNQCLTVSVDTTSMPAWPSP